MRSADGRDPGRHEPAGGLTPGPDAVGLSHDRDAPPSAWRPRLAVLGAALLVLAGLVALLAPTGRWSDAVVVAAVVGGGAWLLYAAVWGRVRMTRAGVLGTPLVLMALFGVVALLKES